ncbi:MAG TPA: NAD-dependent deacetylase [Dehalococcoidia bacterium]|nr:NAD-dependent deacetylase [Dehalococcoidia bacterium]
MSESDLNDRIETLVQWISQAQHLVVFTGAGISTESGLPDFRGPDGLWTRRDKGLPPPQFDWSSAKPNQSHIAIAQLQDMGKLAFLISQNIDNLHLESGINPDSLAELHGNLTKLRCRKCGYKCDSFPDLKTCPLCKGELRTSVVNFGDPMPADEVEKAEWHSRRSDLFIVAGSSLVVYPAADMPRIAFQSGSKLVIINRGETPLDGVCHLRFQEAVGEVLVPVVARLQEIMDS